jgi:uncharacterized protein (TIGR03118 family)
MVPDATRACACRSSSRARALLAEMPPSPSSSGFQPASTTQIPGGFTDPDIPAGFAPFGIQNINGDLFVTYALQYSETHDDVAGAGNGFVDIFDTDGHLLQHFASRGTLNSPWGIARASFAFGRFSGDIVGNFGNGKIMCSIPKGDFSVLSETVTANQSLSTGSGS